LNEGIGFYLQTLSSSYFLILLSSFTVIEYSFICYFIYLILPKNSIKKLIPYIWLAFTAFALIDFFYFNKMKAFDSFAIGIESIIVILLCVYYLFTQIKGSNNLMLYSTFNFWVIIAFLILFSGTLFLYLLTDSMKKDIHFQKLYFIINISFNILKNILLSVAMCMKTNDANKLKPSLPNLDEDAFFLKNS
jgi:hypothetical protein